MAEELSVGRALGVRATRLLDLQLLSQISARLTSKAKLVPHLKMRCLL